LSAYVVSHVTKTSSYSLDDLVDLLLEDREYADHRTRVSTLLPWRAIREIMQRPSSPNYRVPASVSSKVADGVQIEHALARATLRAVAAIDADKTHLPVDDSDVANVHMLNIYDPNMPPPVRSALHAQRAGEICGYALLSGRITNPTLADELADRWIHGMR